MINSNIFHKYTERYNMSTLNREDILTEIATVQTLQLKFQDNEEIVKELDDQIAWLLERLDQVTNDEIIHVSL